MEKYPVKSNLEFIKCTPEILNKVFTMYEHCVKKLEETINYPKWTKSHPSREYVEKAVENNELFACVKNETILGALVLSENPEGNYSLGNWTSNLKKGEYLAIHILAVDPEYFRSGIGVFLVKNAIAFAKKNGYKALRLDVVPGNIPAKKLYETNGFTYAGKKDLQRNIAEIPFFELYELNF